MESDSSKNSSFTVRELAEIAGGQLIGDGSVEILSVAGLDKAQEGEISFVEKEELSFSQKASCLIVTENFSAETECPQIKVKNPKLAFAKIAALLHPPKKRRPEIHSSAVIAESATVGTEVFIGAHVCVGENSSIGDGTQIRAGAKIGDHVTVGNNCLIHPNVFLEDNVRVGNNVILHSGVVVGTDGFGYVRDREAYIKVPQIGIVVIEDDVEIGANSCIDRGALGATRIGKGTKIDNLVQIAHNVDIGERVVIAAQTGISGSTVIEDDCVIGGQVGFGDHARVLTGAIIGSKAGILPGKIVRPGVWWGIPVQPLDEYKRQNAMVKGLPRLREEVRELKRRIDALKDESDDR